ncbi:hypothetical protein EVAR_55721_1 [Eumeta japonica]|uniref:Uncharacterized protein n=1 Tax=Eumeta variegata TaxID=151549 RepID=A0A4C1Z3N4_EUMVA|nr:hypothetical protein EVAR_55721_1 [Eumeta japonica]
MRSLRSMCKVSRRDRCRNSYVRERCGPKEDVVIRVERGRRIENETRIDKHWGRNQGLDKSESRGGVKRDRNREQYREQNQKLDRDWD